MTIKLPGPSFWQKNDDYEIRNEDCKNLLKTDHPGIIKRIHLTFLDPPFNQGKEYNSHNDNMSEDDYWDWLTRVCKLIYQKTAKGGAIYFMQREKNTSFVLQALSKSGWTFQNLIIWRKKSAAVPGRTRYAKHYQIIAYATKGDKPRVFNKLRIDPPYAKSHSELGYRRPKGMILTDVWDDIRELTSGYFAGDEPLRLKNGDRFHKQQSPVALLTRIILSSSKVGDLVFDPFAGTGTTLVVSKQLRRSSIGLEIDSTNVKNIKKRITKLRKSDKIDKLRNDYVHTQNLDKIW